MVRVAAVLTILVWLPLLIITIAVTEWSDLSAAELAKGIFFMAVMLGVIASAAFCLHRPTGVIVCLLIVACLLPASGFLSGLSVRMTLGMSV